MTSENKPKEPHKLGAILMAAGTGAAFVALGVIAALAKAASGPKGPRLR